MLAVRATQSDYATDKCLRHAGFSCESLIMLLKGTAPGESASQEPSGSYSALQKSRNGLHRPMHSPDLQRLDLSGRASLGKLVLSDVCGDPDTNLGFLTKPPHQIFRPSQPYRMGL
ncbi:hypothetical protein MHYP_G00344230 [Metynnis hypsauchen]